MRQQTGISVLTVRFLFCCLLLSCTVVAQQPLLPAKPSFRSFNPANGLPSSETYETFQDRAGYLWIATDRGVARYDGYRFTVFTTNEGLVDNVVLSFYEDSQNRIWFLSLAGTLCYYENGKIVPYQFNHIIRQRIMGVRTGVKQIRVEKDGTLTYSMRGIGGFSIDTQGRVTDKYKHSGHYIIEQIGTEVNFYTTNAVTSTVYRADVLLQLNRDGEWIYPGFIMAGLDTRLLLHQSLLFVIENRDLHCVQDDQLIKLTSDGLAIGMYSDDTSLWIGYLNKGVVEYKYDKRTRKLREVSHFFNGYSVSSINKDSEGGYWFTTLEAGVMYIPFPKVVHYTKQNGLTENFVSSVNGIGNDVFVLSSMGTIQQMNAPWGRFGEQFYTRSQLVRFGKKLLTTGNPGVEGKYPQFNNLGYPFPGFSKLRFEEAYTNKSHLLMFCGDVLLLDKRGKATILYHALYYKDVQHTQESFDALVMDDDHKLFYAGNRYGLFKIADKQAFSMDQLDTLFRVRVSDMTYDRKMGFIVGTRGAGVYLFKNDRIYRQITEKDGLLSNQINFLYLDDDKRLWIGSNKGLTVVEMQDGQTRMRYFTTKNGLISNEINSIYVDAKNSRIWVATKAGVSVLPLTWSLPGQRPSALFLGGVRTLRGEQPLTRHYFEAGTSFMEITFRTTNFNAAPYHLFRYRLHPEDPWIVAWEPKITLNDPSPGDYVLEVSYRDGNGNWIASKTIHTFTINSPFWMKWYFFAACFLVLSAIVFYLFRVRIRQINRRHYYETRINHLEQKALAAQMNPHFIFNSLNSIQSFLVYEENEKAERYLLKFSSLIRQTLANSRERYIRIEQEIKILKDYLELEQMRFQNRFAFQIQSHLSPSELQSLIPPMLIQPYVENAILHGVSMMDSGGMIKIIFEVSESNNLIISIDDNGIGRKAAEARKKTGHRSFGTTITQERLRFLNNDLGNHFNIDVIDKMKDGKPDGTRIVIQLPIRTYYEPEDSDHY